MGAAAGVRPGFRALPIPDRGVPTALQPLADLVHDVKQAVESGDSVAVHCRQGIGRSALLVASVMAAFGEDPAEAFEKIALVRGRPVPDTTEQKVWVEQFGPSLMSPRTKHGPGRAFVVRENPPEYGGARSKKRRRAPAKKNNDPL